MRGGFFEYLATETLYVFGVYYRGLCLGVLSNSFLKLGFHRIQDLPIVHNYFLYHPCIQKDHPNKIFQRLLQEYDYKTENH